MNALRSLSLVALIALAVPRAALSSVAAPRLLLPFEDQVHAGQTVELRWSDLPPGTRELEILLSVDGGRQYRLRVSPELEPEHGGFAWRVPNLPAGDARLLLRYSCGAGELSGEPSAPFRIEGRQGAEPERRQFHEGSWWSGPEDVGQPVAPPGIEDANRTSLDPSSSSEISALAPRAPVDRATLDRVASDPCEAPANPRPMLAARPTASRFTPLRN